MQKINKKALVISIILALISGIVLFQYITSLKVPVEEKPKITILTAVRNFQPGDEVKAADILEKQVEPDSVSLMGLTTREQIVGKIVKLPILAGEVFAEGRLIDKEKMQLSYQIPEGKRALNLFVNESVLFSDLIQVGDCVDIIGSFSQGTTELEIEPFTQTTIQNIEILAIGTEKLNTLREPNLNQLAKTITLAVTPKEAEQILYLSNYGQYNFVLRKKDDDEVRTSDGVILKDIVPSKAISKNGGE